jgi:2-dehydropantoate 2-reductase
MKTLIYGAGPLGCVYSHLLHRSGKDVTLLVRGDRFERIKTDGVVLTDGFTGSTATTSVPITKSLEADDEYDLVIVLIRKNKLDPVFENLAANKRIENILFMGNNALGFEEYVPRLPARKVLFGFPGAGGGAHDGAIRYVDREKPTGKRRAVTIGEMDGMTKDRTQAVISLFESSKIPVETSPDIDAWLKFHVALISPFASALYKHDCDNYALAKDTTTIRTMIRAAKEGGRVLNALGYKTRYPFEFNLFYWLPEFMNIATVKKLLRSRFAEVAFAQHANAARDEMRELAIEFQSLIDETSVRTPNITEINRYIA